MNSARLASIQQITRVENYEDDSPTCHLRTWYLDGRYATSARDGFDDNLILLHCAYSTEVFTPDIGSD